MFAVKYRSKNIPYHTSSPCSPCQFYCLLRRTEVQKSSLTNLFMCIKVQAGTITGLHSCVLKSQSISKQKIRAMITDEYLNKNSQYRRLLTESWGEKPDRTPLRSTLRVCASKLAGFYNFSLPVDEMRSKHTGAC